MTANSQTPESLSVTHLEAVDDAITDMVYSSLEQDNTPLISMEVSLGQQLDKGQVIDIDMPALYDNLRAFGIENAAGKVSLIIADLRNSKILEKKTGGHANADIDGAEVVVGFDRDDQESFDRVLRHEFQHAREGLTGINESHQQLNDTLNFIGHKAFVYTPHSLYAAAGSGLAYIGGVIITAKQSSWEAYRLGLEVEKYLLAGMVGAAAVSFAIIATSLTYLLDPEERRARAAEEEDTPSIIYTK